MNYYNLDKLIKVTINDLHKSRWYICRAEKKILGFRVQSAGIYSGVFGYYEDELPEYHHLINGEVFEWPEVILHYHDNHSKVYYFPTLKEAQEFAKQFTNDKNWIS